MAIGGTLCVRPDTALTKAQWFNWRHERCGYLLQGRYKAILVEKESYVLELCRYIVLNPVRAGLVEGAGLWAWSSYGATAGDRKRPPWLCTEWVLSQFGSKTKQAQGVYRGSWQRRLGWVLHGRICEGKSISAQRFLRLMRERIEAMGTDMEQVLRNMMVPDRPTVEEIFGTVAEKLGV